MKQDGFATGRSFARIWNYCLLCNVRHVVAPIVVNKLGNLILIRVSMKGVKAMAPAMHDAEHQHY